MYLITGATGLLGSHLLYELLRQGNKVRALKRENSSLKEVHKVFSYYEKDPEVLLSRVEWMTGSLTDKGDLAKAMEGVDQVYHCAAMVSFNTADKEKMMEVNVGGTANLVDLALENKIHSFCMAGSVASLGPGEEGVPVDESCFWKKTRASSWYSWSKFQSEMEVWRGMAAGLNAVIVNPSTILGPGNWNRSSGKLFYTISKGLYFYTLGITGYVDVRDVVFAMIELVKLQKFGERFILNSENLTYKEVFTKIALALGRKPPCFKASRFLSSAAWRLDWLKGKLTPWPQVITKEIVRAGRQVKPFSNKKVYETLGMKFIPVDKTIQWVAEKFLEEKQKNVKTQN